MRQVSYMSLSSGEAVYRLPKDWGVIAMGRSVWHVRDNVRACGADEVSFPSCTGGWIFLGPGSHLSKRIAPAGRGWETLWALFVAVAMRCGSRYKMFGEVALSQRYDHHHGVGSTIIHHSLGVLTN